MDKDRFLKKLGERIVKLREAKGLTQADLARQCDKEPQSIERIENGKINPSSYYMYEIAKGLGVSIKELFDLDSSSKK
jgi:putative transcriptional regulator